MRRISFHPSVQADVSEALSRYSEISQNLVGSDLRTLVDLEEALGPGSYAPYGLVRVADQLFWTDPAREAIYTAGVDGKNARILIRIDENGGGTYARGIAASGNQLFWANQNRTIHTSGLDGSNPRVLLDMKATFDEERLSPQGIAVSGSLIYWSEFYTKAIYSARLDGSNPQKLFELPYDAQFITVLGTNTRDRSLKIIDLQRASSSPPFQQTWSLTWTSNIAENYKVYLSEDLNSWIPTDGLWPSEGFETQAEILLPENLTRMFFRVERQ